MTASDVATQLKTELISENASLSKSKVRAIAEYKARIICDQDYAQIAYLKVFESSGRSFNPLRSSNRLANPTLNFPISVICGADGESGGNSDCFDFVKVNRFYDFGTGLS